MDLGIAARTRDVAVAPLATGRKLSLSHGTIAAMVGASEALLVTMGGASAPLVYSGLSSEPMAGIDASAGISLLCGLIYVLIAKTAGLYNLPSLVEPARHMRRIVTVCGTVILGLTAFLFLFKVGSHVSRGAVIGFSLSMLLLCCIGRIAAAAMVDRLMSRSAIVGVPVFLIGDNTELDGLSGRYLLRQFGLREVGRATLDEAEDTAAVRERLQDALSLARTVQAAEFLVASRWDNPSRLAEIEEALRLSPLTARLLPSAHQRAAVARYAPAEDATQRLLQIQRAPMSKLELATKRVLDIAGALFGLVLLLPVLVFTACAILYDSPGPVVFRQRRNGFDQRQFTIFKFRSMHVLDDGDTIVQARRGDKRVTRVGRFLRSSSLDEVPQLVNVLLGTMSLVGPRPHALAHDREYTALIDNYCMRHHVKPGLTGWAQVNGHRGETTAPEAMKQRIDYDVWYIKNWSLLLDIRIIFRTVFTFMKHDAY